MRLPSLSCLAAIGILAAGTASASTVPDALSLGSLTSVLPAGSNASSGLFSPLSFTAANTPYNDGHISMAVTFDAAGTAADAGLNVAGGDSLHTTGYDNTPATVTLVASNSTLVAGSNAVPEPASMALLAAGLLGLVVVRARRHA